MQVVLAHIRIRPFLPYPRRRCHREGVTDQYQGDDFAIREAGIGTTLAFHHCLSPHLIVRVIYPDKPEGEDVRPGTPGDKLDQSGD